MKRYSKSSVLLVCVFVLFLFLSYKIISPYIVAILSAFVLAYLIRPVYLFLNRYFNKSLSGIFSILLLAIFIFLPTFFLIGRIYFESKNFIFSPKIKSLVSEFFSDPVFYGYDVSGLFEPLLAKFSSYFGSLLSSIPSLVLSFSVALLGIYYILTNWDLLIKNLKKYIPEKNKEKKVEEIKEKTNAILYGTFLIGVLQGGICLLCFYFLGVSNPVIFSVLIFLASVLPGIGPGLIWMPLAFYYLLVGNIFTGVGVIAVGAFVSYFIGLVVSPRVLGGNARINPFIMMVGILGGIGVFGAFGFVIGPLVLVYTIELLDAVFS